MDETKLDGAKILSDSEFEFHNAHCFKITVPEDWCCTSYLL